MILEERGLRILEYLLSNEAFISTSELADALNVSKRSVYYELERVNQWLSNSNIDPVNNIRNKGYHLDTNQKKALSEILTYKEVDPIYTLEERQILILCALLQNQEQVHAENLMDLIFVSRNTFFNDLRLVRNRLVKYGLSLNYIQSVGYHIEGDIIKIRSLFLHYFSSARPILVRENFVSKTPFSFLNHEQVEIIYQELKSIENDLGTEYVVGTLYALATLIHVIITNEQILIDDNLHLFNIDDSEELKLLKNTNLDLSDDDYRYFALHLLASRTQIENTRMVNPEMSELSEVLVNEFEKLAAVKFTLRTALIQQLAVHLSLSYYRYKYGIQYGNLLLDRIKDEYRDVYDITYASCDIIRNKLEVPVSESEVGYITLHFNSFIHNNRFHTEKYIIDIVCPSGVSTSAMMRTEILQLHSKIEIGKQMSLKEFGLKGSSADLVVSTVNLETDLNVVVVEPILRKTDRDHILALVGSYHFKNEKVSLEQTLSIVLPYIEETKHSEVKSKLFNYFNRTEEHDVNLTLNDVLNLESIQVSDRVNSFEDAITLASQPLIDQAIIETRYVDKIIENIGIFGPYMVLNNGYMLAHASFMDGANQIGLSFLKLNQPVTIGEKQCDKIFVLSMIDQTKHLGVMKELLDIFNDEVVLNKINDATNINTLDSLLLG